MIKDEEKINIILEKTDSEIIIKVDTKSISVKLEDKKLDAKKFYELFKGNQTKLYVCYCEKVEDKPTSNINLLYNEVLDVVNETYTNLNEVITSINQKQQEAETTVE